MFSKTQTHLMLAVSGLALSIAMATIPVAAQQKPQAPNETLPDVEVSAQSAPKPGSAAEAVQTPPQVEKYQLPVTSTTVTATKIQDQINVVDTEDAIKYEPSLFVRKRNNGDTSPVLATRTWGVNSSARTLIYGDDVLLSSLIANNNTMGSPRFGLVSPDEIKSVDFLYGPYSAAYPGNSMGGVMLITTQMPDKPIATIKQTETFQQFKWYGVNDTYATHQTNGMLGNRHESFSWILTASYTDSHSQPVNWLTSGSVPANTTGTYRAVTKVGYEADVVGAGGMLHTQMANVKLKTAVDITPWLTASYTLSYWGNDGKSDVKSFLKNNSGLTTYAGLSTFASNKYTIEQQHVTNAVALKTDTKGEFDWELSANRYDMFKDLQRSPNTASATAASTLSFSDLGKAASWAGTNWYNADAKGIWRPFGLKGAHEISFGVHNDQYELNNPTYNLTNWTTQSSSNSLSSKNIGKTNTTGLWIQDAWRFASGFKLTLGGREEFWKAFDGLNIGSNTIPMPTLSATRFSPKASLTYEINKEWDATTSIAQAYRFPTVGELYQTCTGCTIATYGNPNLKPEEILSNEVSLQRKFDDGKIRLTLFSEGVKDALISQYTNLNNNPANPGTYVTNVGRIRNTGIELAAQKDDVFINGFQIAGSVTWVDSRIQAHPSWVRNTAASAAIPASITSVVGNKVPYVPEWRSSLVATYKPDDHWSFSFGGRYYGKMYSTLENIDLANNTYGSFNPFLVFDTRIQYKFDENHSIGLGVDNIGNEKYTLFHPFPGRTFILDGKIKF